VTPRLFDSALETHWSRPSATAAKIAPAQRRRDYNTVRPHSRIGWLTPAAYAAQLTATGQGSALIEGSAPCPDAASEQKETFNRQTPAVIGQKSGATSHEKWPRAANEKTTTLSLRFLRSGTGARSFATKSRGGSSASAIWISRTPVKPIAAVGSMSRYAHDHRRAALWTANVCV